MNPYIYGQVIFNKDAKEFSEKGKSFQRVVLAQLDIHIQKHEVLLHLG
jgi:hypothetical protein